MFYGILKSITNTGLESELSHRFVAPLNILTNQPEYVQDSMNLTRNAASQGVQRWEIETNLEPTSTPADLLVHSVDNGSSTRFWIRMPQLAGLATTSAAVSVLGNFAKSTDTFNISGAQSLVKGEFITFANDTKVYLVKVAGENGSGIKVHPKLRKALVDGQVIKTGGAVSMFAMYDTDAIKGVTYVDGWLVDNGSVRIIEALTNA